MDNYYIKHTKVKPSPQPRNVLTTDVLPFHDVDRFIKFMEEIQQEYPNSFYLRYRVFNPSDLEKTVRVVPSVIRSFNIIHAEFLTSAKILNLFPSVRDWTPRGLIRNLANSASLLKITLPRNSQTYGRRRARLRA